MTRPTCETCPFWEMHAWCQEVGGPPYVGSCYRYPPSLAATEDQQRDHCKDDPFYGHWPTTGISAWCGEHPDTAAWIKETREDLHIASS